MAIQKYSSFMDLDSEYGMGNWNLNKSILLGLNHGYRGDTEPWVNFDRWYTVDEDLDHVDSKEYMFMLRPDLNLLMENPGGTPRYQLNSENGVAGDGLFIMYAQEHPEILYSLCAEFDIGNSVDKTIQSATNASGLGNSFLENGQQDNQGRALTVHTLIPYMTSRFETCQLPDLTISEGTLTQPYTNYALPFANNTIESKTGGTFDITFREDKKLSVHKMIYAWLHYMDGVKRNIFQPKRKYIVYNAFDYATSIYTIKVDATGENIIHWSKYTGCFPTTAPMSNMSPNRGSVMDNKLSVPFRYFYHEQMDLDCLVDFNYNSLGFIYMDTTGAGLNPDIDGVPVYNVEAGYMGTHMVGRPFIKRHPTTGKLQLKWMSPES